MTMRCCFSILIGVLSAQAAVDEADFRKTVEPFLDTYCLKCHEKLTFRYGGRDIRLTDVYGNVVHDIIA